MKSLALSVPADTFPAEAGDRVRVRLKNINGLDTIDTLVVSLIEGCGAADKVVLWYDETLLTQGVSALAQCNISGFKELCDCCEARVCTEVFAPTAVVEVGTWLAMVLPADFRLDQIKIYSHDPKFVAIEFQVIINGVNLFSSPMTFDGTPLTINRIAFAAPFATGILPMESVIEIKILDAPDAVYYEEPWRGLTFCVVGVWIP